MKFKTELYYTKENLNRIIRNLQNISFNHIQISEVYYRDPKEYNSYMYFVVRKQEEKLEWQWYDCFRGTSINSEWGFCSASLMICIIDNIRPMLKHNIVYNIFTDEQINIIRKNAVIESL